jgi:hypothetical protein
MATCSVLRCTNPGSAYAAGSHPAAGYHSAYVCGEHRALIESGSPWDMEGCSVLTGQDMPPVLENWSARPSEGSEGFRLTLEAAGGIKPFEVFLTPTEAKTLASFLYAAHGDAA